MSVGKTAYRGVFPVMPRCSTLGACWISMGSGARPIS